MDDSVVNTLKQYASDEDLQLLYDCFVDRYFHNWERIRSNHIAKDKFDNENCTLLQWIIAFSKLDQITH